MNILVTGGDSYLAQKLLEYKSDFEFKLMTFNRSELNLVDKNCIYEKLESTKPDHIINFAGSNSGHFEIDYLSNVVASQNLLECVKFYDKKIRILLIGSSAEYRINYNKTYYSESEDLYSDKPYGITKIIQTSLMKKYVNEHNLNIVMGRIFNVFGDSISEKYFLGKLEGRLISISKYSNKEELIIYNINRDYLHYNNIIKKLIKLLTRADSGEVYNVGSGVLKSMNEITDDFIEYYKYNRSSDGLIRIFNENLLIPNTIISDNHKFNNLL